MEPCKWLRCHGFPLHHCGRQKSEIGLTKLKSGVGKAVVLLEAPVENVFPCPFQLPDAAYSLWLMPCPPP